MSRLDTPCGGKSSAKSNKSRLVKAGSTKAPIRSETIPASRASVWRWCRTRCSKTLPSRVVTLSRRWIRAWLNDTSARDGVNCLWRQHPTRRKQHGAKRRDQSGADDHPRPRAVNRECRRADRRYRGSRPKDSRAPLLADPRCTLDLLSQEHCLNLTEIVDHCERLISKNQQPVFGALVSGWLAGPASGRWWK